MWLPRSSAWKALFVTRERVIAGIIVGVGQGVKRLWSPEPGHRFFARSKLVALAQVVCCWGEPLVARAARAVAAG